MLRTYTMRDPDRLGRLAAEYRGPVLVRLPAAAGLWSGESLCALLRAAWMLRVTAVVADLTSIVTWHDGCPEGLAQAHRELASRATPLRVVLWSRDLYAAVLRSAGDELPIYASVDAALRGPDSALYRRASLGA
jgi:hypothetical protein